MEEAAKTLVLNHAACVLLLTCTLAAHQGRENIHATLELLQEVHEIDTMLREQPLPKRSIHENPNTYNQLLPSGMQRKFKTE